MTAEQQPDRKLRIRRIGYIVFFVSGVCPLTGEVLQRGWGGGMSPGIMIDLFSAFVLAPIALVSVIVGLVITLRSRNDLALAALAGLACSYWALVFFSRDLSWRSYADLYELFWAAFSAFAAYRAFTVGAREADGIKAITGGGEER